MNRGLRISLAFALGLLPAAVFADKDEEKEVKDHLEKGNDLLSSGQYEAAERHFAIANTLVPEASGPYAGMGFAQKGLGRCDQAITNFNTYLRLAPTGAFAKD